ncbi:hypothetical protein INT45_004624 [Circinella minor]|uniref:Heterokaryon incompatibility domain-containing protein n=1 Tax=Circinella minor TaxID=1195481 RepID=A0A8H7S1M5_9FUNG|nr:hypothetical protein INT45_004624 [Circinella minor]
MPNYLVRTSDMKVVKGSEVQEGYCTLSYSWNQSGEIVINETGKKSHRRIDQGKHKIIFPGKTVPKKPRGRKRIPGKVKFVKFEGIIQEICKDFNIKYIWYDQMCINQDDEEEKHNEIREMHKIYSNAHCKVALIPDLKIFSYGPEKSTGGAITHNLDLGAFSMTQWMKRMWTLEETVMSSRMLFVGSNIHAWWYCLPAIYFPLFYKQFANSAARILHCAHTRTSTKEHDHVFALANIFPDVMKEITIDYNQDIQELMIQFYGALAKKDLSILCFGPYHLYKSICRTSSSDGVKGDNIKELEYEVPITKFVLPSWTGVDGEHYYSSNYQTSFKNYTVIGRVMQITCSGMTNDQHEASISTLSSDTLDDIPPLPQQEINEYCEWRLGIRVKVPNSTNEKRLVLCEWCSAETQRDDKGCEHVIQELRNLSYFMPINKKNFEWINIKPWGSNISIHFPRLTEVLQDDTQYVLLIGVQFTDSGSRRSLPSYPIIKKHKNCYKAIGLCSIKGIDYLLNDIPLQEQTFDIY